MAATRRHLTAAGGERARDAAVFVAVPVCTAVVACLVSGPASPFRHLYVVPVIAAAVRFGAVGGVLAAFGAVMVEMPRLLAELEWSGPVPPLAEDLISLVAWPALGAVVGTIQDEAREQRRRYEALVDTQRIISGEQPLPAILDALAACLRRKLSWRAIAVIVREADELVVSGGARVHGEALVLHVLSSGEPVFVPDIDGGARPRRAMAVPLVADRGIVGVLAVEDDELRVRDRRLIVALGLHLGLALEHARLVARQRRFADQLEAEVAAAVRARSAFVAVASHELRTPLTGILGFSELLATRSVSRDEARRMAGIIHQEAARLARIIEDLLDLSRLERGLPPQVRPVALHVAAALADAVAVFQRPGATHEVVVDCASSLPSAWVDPDAFDRVVKNLVGNAVKYSPAGSRVEVAAGATVDGIEVSVQDRGRGIPADALARVFEPYYRVPDAGVAARGTGLGLAVVKAIVDALGGEVRIDSAPGRGTRVVVRVPSVP